MLAVKRKAMIKNLVLEKKSVIVSELAAQFSVTEETIRRDLKALEDEGVLTRTYGGAFVQDGVLNDVDLTLRETIYLESKHRIARQCLDLVHNGDSIFLDCSTTALQIARAVKDMRITVLTNALNIANELASSEQARLILIGGTYDSHSKCFSGSAALETLASYYVDTAFFSCRSLSLRHGVTDSVEQNAVVRKLATQRAENTYLVADHTKFNKTSFIKICDFSHLTGIVTDETLSPGWEEMAAQNGLKLYAASAAPSA